uniref:Peptide synthetase NRPS n=1 Tax=uncultured bacterium esnapd14 TaxID=1366594 RepID=S5TUP7_9BACT|nr:peptide synthetase NRPS [uncultured bacterium esnapd14]
MIIRALRLTGAIDDALLLSAAQEVALALELPARPGFRCEPVADDAHCLKVLAAEPASQVLALRPAPDQVVLAVVADPLLLDLRSVYLLLGAVMQAYFGRFRPDEYPSYRDAAARIDQPVPPSRTAWWARRVESWPQPLRAANGGDAVVQVPFDRWARLCAIGDHLGNDSPIAVVALMAWWLRMRQGRPSPAVFLAELDLREYYGLGPVVGPLTDRIAFQVDATAQMSFRELVRRCHAGLLDGVVRYMPFAAVRGLPGWKGCDVAVHYCRTPPLSSATRGEEQLARLGLSVELFREAELARLGRGHTGDAGLAIDVAESGHGIELIGLPLDASAIDKVIADPDIPLTRL